MDDEQTILRELYRSLDERWRPEDVADRVLQLLSDDESAPIAKILNKNKRRRDFYWSSMQGDFKRPTDMTKQLTVSEQLFGRIINFSAADVEQIEVWIKELEQTIGKEYGKNDFKHDRLPKSERVKAGITISRRQYNKRFRLMARMEAKAVRLAREQLKRSLTLASKNRLASKIHLDEFSSDVYTACFIAYYVARCNLRSIFTNTTQVRAFDEICEHLMQLCNRNENTNWWAIAHVLPSMETVAHLDDEQKGLLLGEYFNLLNEAAGLLKELWEKNKFTDDMVVRKGNDSTTWNITAGAWSKLRDGWFSLMFSLGLTDAVDKMCPGKVLRLMAADVVFWHKSSGGDIHADTTVWKQLPRPWEVLSGDVECPRSLVDKICHDNKMDGEKSGWSAPRPKGKIEKYTPTPELVHGVEVGSPLLAKVFRKAGIFSAKIVKAQLPPSTVDEIRQRHYHKQEQRRFEKEHTTA